MAVARASVVPEGVGVELLMPRLPPGFTGAVSPILVKVDWIDGRREGRLDSRGPFGLMAYGAYTPQGRLEITSNSIETGMVGRFEAPLFEDRNPEDSPAARLPMPPLTQVGRIAGNFGSRPMEVRDDADQEEFDEAFLRAWPRWWETMPRPMRAMFAASGWGQAPASSLAPAARNPAGSLPG